MRCYSWNFLPSASNLFFFFFFFFFFPSFFLFVLEFDIFRHNCFMCGCVPPLRFFIICSLIFLSSFFLFESIFLFFSFREKHTILFIIVSLHSTDHFNCSRCVDFDFDFIHASPIFLEMLKKKNTESKKKRASAHKKCRARVTAASRHTEKKKWKLTRQINRDYSGIIPSCLWSISAIWKRFF